MTISIIIAVKTWQKNLEECVSKCLELDYPDFEILIFPDEPIQAEILRSDRVKVVPSGEVSPADKRDLSLAHARGEVFAFLDDDAYPVKDWLKNAVINFDDPAVAAVGGPAVTPEQDSLPQKASGLVYSSVLVSGKFVYRYLPRARRYVDDFPSCNFFVRKSIMQEAGGFNTKFWPGEDTKFCLDIIKLGKKIVYDPKVLVYHHRRPLFRGHLKQITSYAMHRGYFVKRYPETSLKFAYFVPSLLLAWILAGAFLSLFFTPITILYLFSLSAYLLIVLAFAVLACYSSTLLLVPVFAGIILSHLGYGLYFMKGLILQRLKEEL